MREKEPLSQKNSGDAPQSHDYESIRPATSSELTWMGAVDPDQPDNNLRQRYASGARLPLKFRSHDGFVESEHQVSFDNDYDSLDYAPIVSTKHLQKKAARCHSAHKSRCRC